MSDMSKPKNEHKTFYITHKIELLIWLIIALLIISIATHVQNTNIQKDNDYTIFMNDVDGLIEGSPVRMMGIEVGYITKIRPTNEEIYIKFLITDKNITVPQGTVATVEFNGMAGSKSLELYLPDQTTYIDKNVPILTVNPPKRLHDAAGLLSDMFDKLSSIIYTSSSFGNKIQFLNLPSSGEKENLIKFVKYSDTMVEDANKKAEEINKRLMKYKNNEGDINATRTEH